MLADAGISPGAMKPLDVLVEDGGNAESVAAKLRDVPGVVGATAPPTWQRGSASLVEAFPAIDGSAPGIQSVIDRVNRTLAGTDGTLGGPAAVGDCARALRQLPYVLAFVLVLTLSCWRVRSARLFCRSRQSPQPRLARGSVRDHRVHLPRRARSSLWNIDATHAITAWIPLMIFAFLFARWTPGRLMLAHARGVRRPARPRKRSRSRAHRQARDERGAPATRPSCSRSASRRGSFRRNGDPCAPRACTDAAPRRRELVDAGLGEQGPVAQPSRTDTGGGR